MKAVALGAHILDVLVRYVTEIPEGQGGTLVDEIRLSPAGAAGGVAVTLAKLGAEVHSAGALGKDNLGDVLLSELERFGVDCTHLIRREGVQTSTTVLPIRPTGERPALHVIGANGSFGLDDVPWEVIEAADFLHLGGPEFIGPEAATEILRFCGEHGTRTSVDILADGWPELLDMIAPALEHVDYLLPNDDQAMNLTGTGDVVEAARSLIGRGANLVAVTCGEEGSVVVYDGEVARVAAFEVEVVDTTGCGDAYTAGFLRGLSLDRTPVEAARLGSACASLVAQGLGTDAGDFDTEAVLARAGA